MLTLVLGRAGAGKTTFVMNEIRRKGSTGETGLLLIVPEQYSHDAERQLCAVCGDGLSIYGETLTFTSLCRRVIAEVGGAPAYFFDSGGQILMIRRAIESVAHRLTVLAKRGTPTELYEKLLDTVKELKSSNIYPENLEKMAELVSNPLRDKLRDISLIYHAYNTLVRAYGGDSADRLSLLADMIGESSLGETGHIYFDGFNDFTAQETRVIEELVKKKANITVCLTCDPQSAENDVFAIPHETVMQLRRLAETANSEFEIRNSEHKNAEFGIPNFRSRELAFLEKHLFEDGITRYPGECGTISIYSASTRYEECEQAASKIWEWVRGGYRWRDIGVMARNWEDYGQICENVFEKYEIPYFSSGNTDILDRPPAALIDSALEIITSGFEYKSVFRYLKTGFIGISADDCAELENYVIKWNIRNAAWSREWTLPQSGQGDGNTEPQRLESLRREITAPLLALRDGVKGISGVEQKLQALLRYLEDINLPVQIASKAEELEKRGESRLAGEYRQIWDVIVNAIEQMVGILGDTNIDAPEFRKLFTLTLSQYNIGVIPVSLDRTALGGMEMSRRRDLKCLIVLGATDENIPLMTKRGGLISDRERLQLTGLGAGIPAGTDDRYKREMNTLYSTLTLPSSELVVLYPGDGGELPSFIIKRIKDVFGISEKTLREEEYMTAAQAPCFELAMIRNLEFANSSDKSGYGNFGAELSGQNRRDSIAEAARAYFCEFSPGVFQRLEAADSMLRAGRGRLSKDTSILLYGRELQMSASRVDRYYSCPFQHFAQNGLRLNPREIMEFDAPSAGIFTHYVLESVAQEIKGSTGFRGVEEETCRNMIARYIERYIDEELYGFEGKNARFAYLFNRLEGDVLNIVTDMLDELKNSDFEPLDFELDFSDESNRQFNLSGVVDRVDGWERDGKLYLRVVDYKTGNTQFDLTDVIHGRNMQMLVYLFALQKHGGAKYGMVIMPAGVLYIPARDVILKLPRDSTYDEIKKAREKELRRSGIVLDDLVVIDAMENGDVKRYLPVNMTKSGISGDSLVSPEQIAALSDHVAAMLSGAADEILSGNIDCYPYFRSESKNACLYCDYKTVCAFDENNGDKRRYIRKMKAEEVWRAIGVENSEFGIRNSELS